ncbi:GtrA family protein [Pararhizobium haloflavum]|uniref:GtrA family protein n=1 Tax=Pararhizobium haloflavum TaxID=2037914 RepID=UPI000C1A4DDA|nr:GtrA family protein [Pararhizobium haloflavum]
MRKLFAFAVVGGTGFIVDAGVLTALLEYRLADKFSARVVAIALALCVTWTLNRRFTFGASRHHVAIEGMRYGSVGMLGSLINYGVYSGLLIAFPRIEPLIALTLGSASATIFAYTGYSKLVFKR